MHMYSTEKLSPPYLPPRILVLTRASVTHLPQEDSLTLTSFPYVSVLPHLRASPSETCMLACDNLKSSL
jgi:hypothetical protein